MRTFFEFFAGGGMARAGLGEGWSCAFANDFDAKKVASYAENWGADEIRCADIRTLKIDEFHGQPDLVWASFPCQDLSLAGAGAGLRGDRSGTFWPFWNLMSALKADRRKPSLIVLENVCGTLSSHQGKDFEAICSALAVGGYKYGAVVLDAAAFTPQSRPRVFFVAVASEQDIPDHLVSIESVPGVHTPALMKAYGRLPDEAKSHWLWWRLTPPQSRSSVLADIVEPEDILSWHNEEETDRLLSMMSELHRRKIATALRSKSRMVGTLYRRTRPSSSGGVQRAEVRFDGTAGCLRTPAGGSSRQVVVVVENGIVRSRLVSAREAARLMGLPESYKLPHRYNEAYHLLGDGVAVPVVRFLREALLDVLVPPEQQDRLAA